MMKFKSLFASLVKDESGSQLVECALVLALLVLLSITPLHYFGTKIAHAWTTISNTL